RPPPRSPLFPTRRSSDLFTAADGRTGGAALTMVTKSGTNVFHGSAFMFERDRSLTAKDYFTKAASQDKAPFNRKQFGGSLGGPIDRKSTRLNASHLGISY